MARIVENFWLSQTDEISVTRLGLAPEFVESVPGDWVGFDLPRVGEVFKPGEGFAFVTTDRGHVDLRAPVAMRVVRVNERLRANAGLAALSPMHEGWVVEFESPEGTAIV